MSVRDQERRQKETERRLSKVMDEADRNVRGRIEQRAQAASNRAQQVVTRIEKGGVDPRPLPGTREDSMESLPSMESMPSMQSMPSMWSAGYASEVSDEEASGVKDEMPLQGIMPYDPESAGEDLAQKVTEDTESEGDPHLHNEQKADEIARQITDDTDAGGDMIRHAERKVEQMGSEMFED